MTAKKHPFGDDAFNAGLLAGEIIRVSHRVEEMARNLGVSLRLNPGRASTDYHGLRDMSNHVGRLMAEFERLRGVTTEDTEA